MPSVGDPPSMLEPIHGSASDITGKVIANPVATFGTVAQMVKPLGERNAANCLMKAAHKVCEIGVKLTDIGGTGHLAGSLQSPARGHLRGQDLITSLTGTLRPIPEVLWLSLKGLEMWALGTGPSTTVWSP